MRYSAMCRIPEYQILQQPKDSPASDVTGMFSQLDILQYRKPVDSRPTVFKKLFPHDHPNIPNLHFGIALNVLWQCSFTRGLQPSECQFWNGFLQIVKKHNPSNLRTLYTALCFAGKLIDQCELGFCPVTFDQPLYPKASQGDCVQSSTDLRKLFVKLG